MRRITWIAAMALVTAAHGVGVVGQWEFNGDLNSAMGGQPLAGHGTITFENATINAQTAQVAKFIGSTGTPANDAYFTVTNPIGANGGGSFSNQYSIVMDVMFPTNTSSDGFISLYQTATGPNSNDGDWFIRGDGGMGISGDYTDTGNALRFDFGNWRRVALVIDTTSPTGNANYRTYIDGVLQNQVQSPSGWGLDGRFSLGSVFHMFADDDGETNGIGFINSLQLRDYAMSADEVDRLGGATAGGIVPEPASFAILGLGALALLRRRRTAV